MKILLDPEIFQLQRYGGISRYYTELFTVLKLNKNIKVIIPFYSTNNIYFNQSNLVNLRQKAYNLYLRFLIKFKIRYKENSSKRNLLFFNKSLAKKNYDLFVPTFYNPSFLEINPNTPFVLTVYDMIHELFPEYFIEDTHNVVANKKILIERASRIIAVSENTKKDILKIYPHIDSHKIHVVYHASSLKKNEALSVSIPDEYILFVGNRVGYKNFQFLIDATSQMLRLNSKLHIVCAGGGSFNNSEIEHINKLDLANQIIQIDFREEELSHFYINAKCFVFPSLYEGFGIPILEAMRCGCPVVLSKMSSFPEVAGDAGVYFEQNDSIDLKNKIEKIIDNPEIRKDYIQRGYQQAEKFSWEKAAKECLQVYELACSKN